MITVGIDEVGRGCWAGPLVAGAVILQHIYPNLKDSPLEGLRDSKKLSKKQRERLAEAIKVEAVAVGLGWVWPAEIDERGITWAVKTAMERALAEVKSEYDEIIIDGNINYLADVRGRTSHITRAVIKADDSVPSVSAASIVAKVARDRYMAGLGEKYAGYEFERHVGYGTAAHVAALKTLGVSDIHRRSYKPIKEFLVGSF